MSMLNAAERLSVDGAEYAASVLSLAAPSNEKTVSVYLEIRAYATHRKEGQ